jgi:hypothetical protein
MNEPTALFVFTAMTVERIGSSRFPVIRSGKL